MAYPKPRPTKHRFKVKRSYAGLGLFAETPIKKGDFIIEYWGEIITDEQAEKKGGEYLFDLDETPYTINGALRANTARYINHSCKPNCEPEQEGRHIYIKALRRIEPGEELTYDYGPQYFKLMVKEHGGCRCGHHGLQKKR